MDSSLSNKLAESGIVYGSNGRFYKRGQSGSISKKEAQEIVSRSYNLSEEQRQEYFTKSERPRASSMIEKCNQHLRTKGLERTVSEDKLKQVLEARSLRVSSNQRLYQVTEDGARYVSWNSIQDDFMTQPTINHEDSLLSDSDIEEIDYPLISSSHTGGYSGYEGTKPPRGILYGRPKRILLAACSALLLGVGVAQGVMGSLFVNRTPERTEFQVGFTKTNVTRRPESVTPATIVDNSSQVGNNSINYTPPPNPFAPQRSYIEPKEKYNERVYIEPPEEPLVPIRSYVQARGGKPFYLDQLVNFFQIGDCKKTIIHRECEKTSSYVENGQRFYDREL